ncbi:fumarylacetoacetate hydrolase family protein [Bradyrhizobium prioriisuperbiae]|uniref:fumarylacetoacetate hydrolase family protein n=1 Tax=Bradyrhizobium prioriisuperbiae TaxID=2854389 RepID=UPI0028E6ACEF|nr:fumarylacetoacetate hydrolase family protein [Bradyrhizobium prioritasuperba]
MKLVRFGKSGFERPGVLMGDGSIRDVSNLVPDFDPVSFQSGALEKLRSADLSTLPVVDPTVRLGAPVARPGKLIGVGLNYADHAAEAGHEIPPEPIFFLKATSAINGPHDPIVLPRNSRKADWEIELAFVVGKTARYVEVANALEHVAGYTLLNDVSEREMQLERGSQWTKGKSCDTFAPLGPWLVTPEDIADPQAIDLQLAVNNIPRQTGSTRTMVWSVAELVSFLSTIFTLHPGDVVGTGTPPGVGNGMKPPVYLKAGDVLTVKGAGLGEQRSAVWDETNS